MMFRAVKALAIATLVAPAAVAQTWSGSGVSVNLPPNWTVNNEPFKPPIEAGFIAFSPDQPDQLKCAATVEPAEGFSSPPNQSDANRETRNEGGEPFLDEEGFGVSYREHGNVTVMTESSRPGQFPSAVARAYLARQEVPLLFTMFCASTKKIRTLSKDHRAVFEAAVAGLRFED